jgi:hypothetical protein
MEVVLIILIVVLIALVGFVAYLIMAQPKGGEGEGMQLLNERIAELLCLHRGGEVRCNLILQHAPTLIQNPPFGGV